MPVEIDIRSVGDSDDCCGDAVVIGLWGDPTKPNKTWVVVIDGGYQADGEAVVQFIAQRYGTTHVDLLVSTHPDCDHCNGLHKVLSVMTVGELWMHQPWTMATVASMFHQGKVSATTIRKRLADNLNSAHELYDLAVARKVHTIHQPFAGLSYGAALKVLGPSAEFYALQVAKFKDMPKLDLSKLFGKPKAKTLIDSFLENYEQMSVDNLQADPERPTPENSSSVILWLDWLGYSVLFTGDAGPASLLQANQFALSQGISLQSANLVQVPHHGSRHNVSSLALDAILGPKTDTPIVRRRAFVSAPRAGGPKHPSKRAMNAFFRRGTPVTWNQQGPWLHFNHGGIPRPTWVTVPDQGFHSTVESVSS
jgi:beta-lactamase superfamily II metal-dependent hydrolase